MVDNQQPQNIIPQQQEAGQPASNLQNQVQQLMQQNAVLHHQLQGIQANANAAP